MKENRLKLKQLLIVFFILFWTIVFYNTFIASSITRESTYRILFPSPYKMYTSVPKIGFEINFDYYKQGKIIKRIPFQDSLQNRTFKTVLYKSKWYKLNHAFLARLLFLQANFYDIYYHYYTKYPNENQNFHLLKSRDSIKKTRFKFVFETLINFAKKEGQDFDISSDSLHISLKPIALKDSIAQKYPDFMTYIKDCLIYDEVIK